MSAGFRLHPEAAHDITEIWEYIAADSQHAARRVRQEILTPFAISFPSQV
jgi:plasmid stabilization system protein ParE